MASTCPVSLCSDLNTLPYDLAATYVYTHQYTAIWPGRNIRVYTSTHCHTTWSQCTVYTLTHRHMTWPQHTYISTHCPMTWPQHTHDPITWTQHTYTSTHCHMTWLQWTCTSTHFPQDIRWHLNLLVTQDIRWHLYLLVTLGHKNNIYNLLLTLGHKNETYNLLLLLVTPGHKVTYSISISYSRTYGWHL